MNRLVRSRVLICSMVLGLTAACTGPDAAPETTVVAGDLAPGELVGELLTAVEEGRFDDAARLTDSGQAGLLALAEGADANEVVEALEGDPDGVAANFWSGFAQSLDPERSLSESSVTVGDEVTEGESRFVPVRVAYPEGEDRTFYLRQADGWRVDLMATFGHVIAGRLTPRVEDLLDSANPNASQVIGLLNRSAPSLMLAARNPQLDSATHQSLLALLERITRAG